MKVIVTYQDGAERWSSDFYFNSREQYNEEIGYYIDDQTIGIDVIEDEE